MKKIIIFLFFVVIIALFFNSNKVVIPQNSIRFRIIANSNLIEDQNTKWSINMDLVPILSRITSNILSIEDADQKIRSNMNDIESVVNQYTSDYDIKYGMNYFPKKEYQGIIYPEGEYQSLVITLGDGLGDNWWCVLFPPLCLMEAKQGYTDDVEYKSYFVEVLKKYI